MKKYLFLIVLIVAGCVLWAVPTQMSLEELPAASQHFLERYFPQREVVEVYKTKWISGAEYRVVLADGTMLCFDSTQGACIEIEAEQTGVPQMLIPPRMRVYIANTYPLRRVLSLSHRTENLQLRLEGDVVLEMDAEQMYIYVIQ